MSVNNKNFFKAIYMFIVLLYWMQLLYIRYFSQEMGRIVR